MAAHPRITQSENHGEIELADIRMPSGSRMRPLALAELEILLVVTGDVRIGDDEQSQAVRPGKAIVRRLDVPLSVVARLPSRILTIRIPRHFRGVDRYEGLSAAGWKAIRPGAGLTALRQTHQHLVAGNHRLVGEGLALVVLGSVETMLATAAEPRVPPWLAAVAESIGDLSKLASIAGLAREVGVSPSTLAREFRRVEGCTIGAYQRRLRVTHAGRLIRDPALSLARIAHMVGFADQSHFSNAFRRATGQTPREFRRGLRRDIAEPGAALLDPVGEYTFQSATVDGRPYEGTILIYGSPWAYQGYVRTSVMPDVRIETVAVNGNTVVLTGSVPAGTAVLRLRFDRSAFVGEWQLASGGQPVRGRRC